MGLFRIAFFSLFFALAISLPLAAQQLAEDTVYVQCDTLLHAFKLKLGIEKIEDSRGLAPGLMFYGSKKRYLLLPVDVLYCTRPSFERILQNDLAPRPGEKGYSLLIREFQLEKRKGTFFPGWELNVEIGLMQHTGDSSSQYGAFLFHENYPVLRRENPAQTCRRVLDSWRMDFVIGLTQFDTLPPKNQIPTIPSWYPGIKIRSRHLNLLAAVSAGWKYRQMEAEIYFSREEKADQTVYTGGIIRYQNTPDYESISFGRQLEHLRKKLSDSWDYDAYFAPLMGFNKWKNFSKDDPGLLQILQFSMSTAQTLSLHPTGSGLLWKAGLFANAIYIPQKSPVLQVGLYTAVGFRY